MASGNTTTSDLTDSLPKLLASARNIREHEGNMPQLCELHTLGTNEGLDWNEISLDQLTATAINENTVLDNPQLITDNIFTVTPTVVGILTIITERVAKRISSNVMARTGELAQNAIQRKKNADGLTVLDGFSNSHAGAGNTLTSGHISAAIAIIQGNTTEPGNPPYRCVLHPYQIRDIEDEIIAGVGTYAVGEGLTARVFAEGFRGMIAGAQVYPDGNITIDGSDDAKGGVFAQEAIVLVQGRAPKVDVVYKPEIGGGATAVYHYDEYAYGERVDTWGVEIYSDAATPTS
jgi:hypothetical protein